MKIQQISVSVKRLIALKKYENVTYETGVVVSVEEGDNPSEVHDTALQFCKAKILAEMDRLEGK